MPASRLNAEETGGGRSAGVVRATSAFDDLITAAEPALNSVPPWRSRATTEPRATLRKAPWPIETEKSLRGAGSNAASVVRTKNCPEATLPPVEIRAAPAVRSMTKRAPWADWRHAP